MGAGHAVGNGSFTSPGHCSIVYVGWGQRRSKDTLTTAKEFISFREYHFLSNKCLWLSAIGWSQVCLFIPAEHLDESYGLFGGESRNKTFLSHHHPTTSHWEPIESSNLYGRQSSHSPGFYIVRTLPTDYPFRYSPSKMYLHSDHQTIHGRAGWRRGTPFKAYPLWNLSPCRAP